MNVEDLNTVFKRNFDKALHVIVELAKERDDYTKDFLHYYDKKLKNREHPLNHLSNTCIDNNRWMISEDLEIVMYSIPKYTFDRVEVDSCLKIEILKFLSKQAFCNVELFINLVNSIWYHDEEVLLDSLLRYHQENKITRNVREINNAISKIKAVWGC